MSQIGIIAVCASLTEGSRRRLSLDEIMSTRKTKKVTKSFFWLSLQKTSRFNKSSGLKKKTAILSISTFSAKTNWREWLQESASPSTITPEKSNQG